jgi:hypothetical protein
MEKNGNGMVNFLHPSGVFHVEHYRKDKDNKFELINEFDAKNAVVNEGKNFLLDVMFHGTTAAPTWWISLYHNSGGTGVAVDDTYDDIDQAGNDWDEFKDYTPDGLGATDRTPYNEAAASAQQITNSANKAIFGITGAGTLEGIMVVGLGAAAGTQGDHAADGKLWATAAFSGDVSVENGDELRITYTVSVT